MGNFMEGVLEMATLPSIIQQLGDVSLGRAILYGLGISFLLIITRFICTFGASLFTTFMSRFITVADPKPGFKGPIVLGWAGMRGVISLAAALSIPLVINQGQPFPYRNLILFMTFIVILVTLVLQGLTLPWIIKKVNLKDKYSITEREQERIIQKKIAKTSLQLLEDKYGNERESNKHLNNFISRLQIDFDLLQPNDDDNKSSTDTTVKKFHNIYLEVLEQQRKLLTEMNKHSGFDEDLIRKYLSLIDIEEYK